MTVTSTNRINTYSGAGTTGPFSYTFRIFQNSDLEVFVTLANGTIVPLVLGTDYTMTGAGQLVGGTVTTTNPVAVGTTLTLERTLLVEQLSDFRNQGEFFPADYEDALDYGIMVSQQLSDGVASLLSDVTTINTNITTINTSITNINADITSIDASITTLNSEVTTINAEITTINAEIATLQQGGGGKIRRLAATLAAGTHNNYTPGAGTTWIEFEGWSGGAGAGGFVGHGCIGGGSGAYGRSALAVNSGDKYNVVVGAHGTSSTGGSSTNGGATTVTRVSDSHVVLSLGGGKCGDDASPGIGGAVTTADFGVAGEDSFDYDQGFSGYTVSALHVFMPTSVASRGGNAPRGGQGARSSTDTRGDIAAKVPGGGGACAILDPSNTATNHVVDGADGVVLVWEWS